MINLFNKKSVLFPSCKPLPGVVNLVQKMKLLKIPIAVATSSFKGAFELKIQNNKELFDLFDVIVLGDDPDVKKGKPAPDIFIEAAKRLGCVASKKGIVFEDAINGVHAGIKGGFRVVWVPDPHLDAMEMLNEPQNQFLLDCLKDKTLVILKSLEEFKIEEFEEK